MCGVYNINTPCVDFLEGGLMSRTQSNHRATKGCGSIRQITRTVNGKAYKYYEGRATTGYDLGTGKQKQCSITGKTQKEVATQLREITTELDNGEYIEPTKMTVAEWLNLWSENYLVKVKESTRASYKGHIRNHLIPGLGAVCLCDLKTYQVQRLINDLPSEKGLSNKTVKNIMSILNKALRQAVREEIIRKNPCDAYELPSVERKEIVPLDENDSRAFLAAIRGHRFELLYIFTLFTGLREGEVLGLRWECINFERGIITVDKQLQREKKKGGEYRLVSLKNKRTRIIAPAPYVMDLLKKQMVLQTQMKELAGSAWIKSDLVFTNELGRYLIPVTVYKNLKKIVAEIGRPETRFHDLRHSFAVASISAGDDIKTVQGNLGHATASFTLDVYGHVTEQMRKASSERMERYINGLTGATAS